MIKKDTDKLFLFRVNLFVFLKVFIVGIVASVFIITICVLLFVVKGVIPEFWWWTVVIGYILIILIYLINDKLWMRIKSKRIDLFIVFGLGIWSFLIFRQGLIDLLFGLLFKLNVNQILTISLLPLVCLIVLAIKKIIFNVKFKANEDSKSFFLSDNEIDSFDEDKFKFEEPARKFAESIYDNKSSKSIVFGIDAPWGGGKSSFVKLCINHLYDKHGDDILIFNFNPTRYEDEENLLEKFVDGFIREIRNNIFVPEIDCLLMQYAKMIRETEPSFNLFGLSIKLPRMNDTVEKTFNRLKYVLSTLNKKIIIVIDDLDRLNFSSIKKLLFSIKKVFSLPNVSFILCYDINNIVSIENKFESTDKIAEFFEKYVNIKYSLCIDYSRVVKYFEDGIQESLKSNLLTDPFLISQSIAGIKKIYESPDFIYYKDAIGNPRKIKRLINTIVILGVDKTDFKNSDIDKQDLINLLIIYVNYPRIFRDIVDSETNQKRGFFSLVSGYDDLVPEDSKNKDVYQHSIAYIEYSKGLSVYQKRILDNIFARKIGETSQNISPVEAKTLACFNGNAFVNVKGNLEKYLDLILKAKHPTKETELNYYLGLKTRLFQSGESIQSIINDEVFDYNNSGSSHRELWKVLNNTSREEYGSPLKARRIINFGLNEISNYSLLSLNDKLVEFRHTLPMYIVFMLDKFGWYDNENKFGYDNNEENTIKIAHWIFGENEYKNHGIISILAEEKKGILGFIDLMVFRLFCCADRGGNIFNLMRGLIAHGQPKEPDATSQKNLVVDEMREISQEVFKIFQKRYINKKINLFKMIDEVTLEEFCGKYSDYIKKIMSEEEINSQFINQKSKYITYIPYQLTNTIISSGIGCGYYDVEGNKDQNGIHDEMNKYFFGVCFNPDINKKNFEYFLDYLFCSYSYVHSRGDGIEYAPNINHFTRVLDRERFKNYWKKYNEKFRALKFESKNKTVIALNYELTYASEIQNLYKELDKLLEPKEGNDAENGSK